jgi:hypothetical protein
VCEREEEEEDKEEEEGKGLCVFPLAPSSFFFFAWCGYT